MVYCGGNIVVPERCSNIPWHETNLIGDSSMTILPSCSLCGNSFTPRSNRQQRCSSCVIKSKACETCGAKKQSGSPLCKKCFDVTRIGVPNLKNRHKDKPIEQVISEAEMLGLLPEKQYAFGYVMGVAFGDGSISRDIHNNLKRSDGTVRPRSVTLYRVRLQVTSQAFAERFANQWTILTGKGPGIMTSTRTDFSKSTLKGRREEYCVQLFNVGPRHAVVGRYLFHLKYESELYELLRFPPEVMRGIIHGMIDSEGCEKGKHIDIANKRATLLDVLTLMLELLGYKATVYTYSSQDISHLVTRIPYRKFGLQAQ